MNQDMLSLLGKSLNVVNTFRNMNRTLNIIKTVAVLGTVAIFGVNLYATMKKA